jgi:precorrin-4 methylase
MLIKGKIAIYLLIGVLICSFFVISVHGCAHRTAIGKEKGKFYLVGIGPGDPDLATLRAVKVMSEADLIICHQGIKERFASFLEGKDIIEIPPTIWIWHCYGKDPSEFEGEERRKCEVASRKRSEIISEVRKAIVKGKIVAAIDNGDPLIYGPFSWCLIELEDLNPTVIPGLSCFNAANAALRRDVTWGKHTKSVILTADDWPGKKDTIEKLAAHQATMIIFTMFLDFKELIHKLAIHYPPKTPIVVVVHAGYAQKEKVIKGTIETILEQVGNEELPFEHLVYVGDFMSYPRQ